MTMEPFLAFVEARLSSEREKHDIKPNWTVGGWANNLFFSSTSAPMEYESWRLDMRNNEAHFVAHPAIMNDPCRLTEALASAVIQWFGIGTSFQNEMLNAMPGRLRRGAWDGQVTYEKDAIRCWSVLGRAIMLPLEGMRDPYYANESAEDVARAWRVKVEHVERRRREIAGERAPLIDLRSARIARIDWREQIATGSAANDVERRRRSREARSA
jgi:hypothetical protein